MSDKKNFNNFPDNLLSTKGVRALSDRPGVTTQYGEGGLSPKGLKEWFDNIGKELITKVNSLQDTINGEEGSQYIGVSLEDENLKETYACIGDIIGALSSGAFAADLLKVCSAADDSDLTSLQSFINNLAVAIASINENKVGIDRFAYDVKMVLVNPTDRPENDIVPLEWSKEEKLAAIKTLGVDTYLDDFLNSICMAEDVSL